MLLHRIILLSSQHDQYVGTPLQQSAKRDLNSAIELMRQNQDALIIGNTELGLIGPLSKKLRSLYFGPERYVEKKVTEFLELASDHSNTDWYAYGNFDLNGLLLDLEAIVKQYQIENETKVAKLEQYQFLALVITLIFLTASSLFIILPMISRLKDSAHKLDSSEKRLKSISDSSTQVAIVAVDQKGLIISWNNGASIIFGYSKDEILGMPVLKIMPEHYREAHKTGFQQAQTSENYNIVGKTIEIFGLRKDGEEFPIELSIGVWEQDNSKYFSAIIQDISARKQTESRLDEAISIAKLGYWVWDEVSDEIIDCSDEFANIYGTTKKKIFAENFFDDLRSIHPEDRNIVASRYENFSENYDIEFRTINSNDEIHYLREFGQPIFNNNGKIIRSFGTTQDISKSKLEEEALILAKIEAEEASNAKSNFLASMSHELRTPMNAILGFTQMLQYGAKDTLTPTQNEYLNHIYDGGNHLLSLINDVLDLSKIESNHLSMTIEEVESNKIVAETIMDISSLCIDRKIMISDDFSEGSIVSLQTDKLRLKQCLLNILSNAVKYNVDAGTITVSGRETEDGFLRISVTDTGIGILEENHKIIFKMFHMVNDDALIAKEGTGIGLHVTKLLITNMAGRIGFTSDVGVGSTFWIELPLASNQNILIWSDALKIGVDAIDNDHQVLVNLLNKIKTPNVNEGEINSVVDELIEYTSYHFHREETIMDVCEYPGLEKHKELHLELIAHVIGYMKIWRSNNNPDALAELCKFLQNWLFKHIMMDDAELVPYTTGKDKIIKSALSDTK
jgi:hemerythrin-like metal-binding protein/PAS domain S-box-containing protein